MKPSMVRSLPWILSGFPIQWFEHWGGDPGVFTAAYLDPTTHEGGIFTNLTATERSKKL
jgi:hypothetical protein